jgi:hypothetical protein
MKKYNFETKNKAIGKVLLVLNLVTLALFQSCNISSVKEDSTQNEDTLSFEVENQIKQPKISVLVLPPYDEIANAGISPDIRKYIEDIISKDTNLILIPFPFKKLMNVPYSQIFDKKYCKSIIEQIQTDIIVMSKLDLMEKTGYMPTNRWNFAIKIYYINTGEQLLSNVKGENLTDIEIKSHIETKKNILNSEIKTYNLCKK